MQNYSFLGKALAIILVIIFVVLYKFLINHLKYKNCIKYRDMYLQWIDGKCDELTTYRTEIINLFKQADIKDINTPIERNIGRGYIQSASVSAFNNFPSLAHKNLVVANLAMFDDAIGIYRKRRKDAYSPLYWIELLLWAPSRIIDYLFRNFSNNKMITQIRKIANVLWWVVWFFYGVYNLGFSGFINELFNNFY